MLYREVLVWETFKHPYLLPFMGVEYGAFPAHPPCIVTPWMKNGTIINYIDRSNSSMQNTHRLSLEIAQGLDYLHASNVLHGDLRGCNILIDDECHVRLADFGLSTFINGYMSTQSSKEHGSKRWMAPELHDPDIEFRRTAKSDIYSLACVFLEVHTKKHPFAEISIGKDLSVPSKVLGGQRPQRPSAELLPDSVWDIIQAAWAHVPTDRPTSYEILRMMKMIDLSLPVV
ncbi:kinase-like protein [Athelia psychrophila]|uniref:Kinase-like protein n=1 Tax=Athelia psychrophila TaxID=1759441 RepID=A0A166P4V8_9AGAM|nr:kinase-like protein [Fibularhizoctonia sp. CBS 109695]